MGPSALLAYLLCGLAMGLVLLAYAEAGSRVARSGGSYAYVEEAFGPYVGFLVGTLLWFAYGALSDAAIATALVGTLAAAYPPIGNPIPRALLLVVLFAGLALVNVRGVRQGARLAVAATIAKLAPLVLLIVAGIAAVRVEQLAWTTWPSAASLGSTSL